MTFNEINELRSNMGLNLLTDLYWKLNKDISLMIPTYVLNIKTKEPSYEMIDLMQTYNTISKEDYIEYKTFTTKICNEYLKDRKIWKIRNICKDDP